MGLIGKIKTDEEPRARETRALLPKTVFSQKEIYSWLIQPTALTFMRHDYTLMQQRIYATIISCLQGAFLEAKNSVFNHAYEENSLLYKNSWAEYERDFEEKDVRTDRLTRAVPIKIKMKDFNVPRTQYQDLKDSLITFGYSPVGIQIPDRRGNIWVEYACLCKMRIPVKLKKITHVYAVFERAAAIEMFNAMHAGYTKFLKDVILFTRSKYTSRFYLFLSAYANKRSCFTPYEDLRKYLRLNVKYKDYNYFKRDILDVAAAELKTMYEAGLSNLCFTFSPEQRISSTSGGKEIIGITFQITRADNIKDIEIPFYDDARKRNINKLLREYCGCTPESSEKIASEVTEENYQKVSEKVMFLAEKFAAEDTRIYAREAYTIKTFDNFYAYEAKAI